MIDMIFKNPINGEVRTVTLSNQQIQDRLEPILSDELFCDCRSIGESNVIDCNCEDYFDEFILQDQAPESAIESELATHTLEVRGAMPGKWRSYHDAQEIAEFVRRIKELERRRAELEKERAMSVFNFTVDEYKAHNFKQQAKGIEDALNDYDVRLELLAGDKFYKQALSNRVRKLRKQAKS